MPATYTHVEIPLSNGGVTLLDQDDAAMVGRWAWRKRLGRKGEAYYAYQNFKGQEHDCL